MLSFVYALNISQMSLADKHTYPIIVKNIWSLPQ